jgi:hypothetical protein
LNKPNKLNVSIHTHTQTTHVRKKKRRIFTHLQSVLDQKTT